MSNQMFALCLLTYDALNLSCIYAHPLPVHYRQHHFHEGSTRGDFAIRRAANCCFLFACPIFLAGLACDLNCNVRSALGLFFPIFLPFNHIHVLHKDFTLFLPQRTTQGGVQ